MAFGTVKYYGHTCKLYLTTVLFDEFLKVAIGRHFIFPLASVSHPASCKMGTGGPFPGAKTWPGSDADHSPPSSAEVENE
jgi:hypothetical protein